MALPPPDARSTCLVTGASSGIGAELARGLARRGHNLVLTARRTGLLDALAAELRAAHGVEVDVIGCDLSDDEQRERLVAQIAEGPRALEVLVNNAGFATVGPFRELAAECGRERSVVRVCAEAPVHLCEAFVPGMAARGRGAILNVSSIAAFQPMPGMATYAASKAMVHAFTSALHAELAPCGMTVSVLAPGAVRTEFADVAESSELAARIPGMFWSTPAAVAEAALRGLEHGDAVIIPGRFYRAAALVGRHVPRRPLLALAGRRMAREARAA
jgi:short-subunit dehydrogenase